MVYTSPGSGLTRADKKKFGTRAGKYKLGDRAVKYKLGARVSKYKLGARAGKHKLRAGPGARVRAGVGGQAEGRGSGNTNTPFRDI